MSRNRVKILKKVILYTVAAAIIIPVITAVCLGIKLHKVSSQLSELQARMGLESDLDSQNADTEEDNNITSVFEKGQIEKSGKTGLDDLNGTSEDESTQTRVVYLTFDDGPSSNTEEILDILKEYDVKATFFVTGKETENARKMYQRITDEGHTLGMHSYSHNYQEIYQSVDSFAEDISKLQEYLYEITGVWPRYYRFPGGSSNTVSNVDMQELIDYLNDQDITYFDWNVASGDAINGYISEKDIEENCISQIEKHNESIVLLHDANDRDTTVEALPGIIEAVQAMENTEIRAISDNTVPIQHIVSK